MRVTDKKKKIIDKIKRHEFRKNIEKVTGDSQGLWRLAKWAREKSQSPREIPKMPPLKYGDQVAHTFEEKIDMLKEAFFPPPPSANLTDLQGFIYPASLECPVTITEKEVLAALIRSRPDKAPGSDGITNRLLAACKGTLTKLLTPLFQACATLEYHPRTFREAHTIALKKPGKADYTTPKAYRPIALLNTMGKALESIMAEKIAYLAERFQLLPETQMGGRKGRSTDSALELLTEQIHTVWGQGTDKVATLLSMDVANAYPTVSHERLIHNLRKRKIPAWIAKWVLSFLQDRNTTMAINGRVTGALPIRTGIPQGSPISPILYLFYNADLLDICERPGIKANGLGFVDDVNILTYSTSTEENCRTLEVMHKKCELWASRHGAVFAPAKYQLIHLSRNPKKFNMQAIINIASDVVTSKTDIRVLDIQIDTALK